MFAVSLRRRRGFEARARRAAQRRDDLAAVVLLAICLGVASGASQTVPASPAASAQSGEVRDSSPTWVRGGRLAFIRHDESGDEEVDKVMLVDLAKHETELLRDGPRRDRIGELLTASPDGLTLAWTGNLRLFSAQLVRPRMRFLGYATSYSWAPTSRLLVASYGLGEWLRVIRADGTGLVRKVTRGRDLRPAWSPTGSWIAFERVSEPKGASSGIYIVAAAGGRAKRLTRGGGGAAWAPTGRLLAFGEGSDVWTIDVNGRRRRRLLRGSAGASAISWSPKGGRLLVAAPPRFLIVSRSGTVIARVLGANPAWSRDGRRIAYETVDDGCLQPGIWTTTAAGRRPTRLTGAC